MLCGNGGSAADCDHISGELLKGFLNKRPLTQDDLNRFSTIEGGYDLACKLQYGLPAIPLPAFNALISAFSNDVDASAVYAQLVMALGTPGDLLVCNHIRKFSQHNKCCHDGEEPWSFNNRHDRKPWRKLYLWLIAASGFPKKKPTRYRNYIFQSIIIFCAAVEAHFFPQERTD